MQQTNHKKVIVLYGNTLGLGIVRSLGLKDIESIVLYNEKDEIARFSKYVVNAIKCPNFSDYEKLKNFLINKKDLPKGSLLIGSNDRQVEMLSLHKKELSKYFIVPVPDYNIAKLFLDKKETYNRAIKAGIPIPFTIYPENMKEALENLNKIEYPVMIKPRERDKFLDIFNKKLFVVNNEEDLKQKLKLCFKYKLKIMLMEIIPGNDTQLYAYNFYINITGNELAGICQQKLRQSPPNFGLARVMKTVVNNDIINLSRKFLKYIPGFFGQGHLEFKYDTRDQKYKLMEMNGRITLQNELFCKAGVNFPYIYYQEWSGTKPEKTNKYKKDIYWINLWEDIYNTLFRNKEENYSFLDYIRPYLKKNMFAIERFKDPKPMGYFWLRKISDKLLGVSNISRNKKDKERLS